MSSHLRITKLLASCHIPFLQVYMTSNPECPTSLTVGLDTYSQ